MLHSVDIARYKNFTRFVNHSYDPNLFQKCVVYPFNNMTLFAKQAHIVFFAFGAIYVYKEHTIDYNSSSLIQLYFLCGSSNYKGVLFALRFLGYLTMKIWQLHEILRDF